MLNNLKERADFQTNEYVLAEIEEVLREKFYARHGLRTRLFLLLGTANVSVLPNPSMHEAAAASKIISEKDAPILAGALKRSDYLLTLDNEFFGAKVVGLAEEKRLIIMKPKDFIQKLREF